MRHFIRNISGAILLLAAFHPQSAVAQRAVGEAVCVTLPCNLDGDINGAPYRIRVPGNWNGTLLVYLLGVKSPSNNPTVAPLVPPVLSGSQPDLESTLLSRGYALAGTLVADQDMQLKEEVQDGLALTAYFRGRIADPARVIVWGSSLGAIATLRLVEDYHRAFDAGIATCTPGAGFARSMDRRLDFLLAYSVAFGWPEQWGTLAELRPDLDFARDVNPIVQWPKPDGSNRGNWEFIRLVMGVASDAFWQADPMLASPGFGTTMWMATQLRDSLQAWASGPITQNLDRHYTLQPEDVAYLATLGVKADELLARMNAQTNISASTLAREFMDRFGKLRGSLRRPVLSMHTTVDEIAEVSQEDAYRSTVQAFNSSGQLVQAYVKGTGHCAFTSQQLLAALTAVEKWLDTGVRPDAAAFPETLGFDNTFVPPPWPY